MTRKVIRACLFSPVWLFSTPWTVAHQAPLSMGILQARILEWGHHAVLQGIFPIQGSNPVLPHCRQILYPLSHQGSPGKVMVPNRSSPLLTSLMLASVQFSSVAQSCPTLCNPMNRSMPEIVNTGTSLVVQWLRLLAPKAGDQGSLPAGN